MNKDIKKGYKEILYHKGYKEWKINPYKSP